MNSGKSQKQAIFFALVSVLLWSTVATAFKLALRGMNPWQLIFVATLVSLFVFLIIIFATGKIGQLFSISKKDIVRSSILGLLNPFSYYLVLFKAYELNPAQVTQTLNMIWPVCIALLSAPLLGQKITIKNIYAVLVSFVGVVFIASQGSIDGFSKTNSFGAGLALFSSIIWAFYWIFSVKSNMDKLLMMFWNFLFGLVYLLFFGLVDFEQNIDFHIDNSFWSAVYVGFFELGITYLVWMKALAKSENNAVTSNFIFLTPFISLIFIYFILNERIYGTTFVGLSLILMGIFIQQFRKKEMLLQINSFWRLLSLALVALLVFSCTKDDEIIDEVPPVEEEEQEEVVENSKTFIYDHFRANYLWLDQLPEVDPNTYISDQELVNALRYEDVDRWSYVANLQEHNALFEDAQTKGFGVGMSYFMENVGEEEKARLFVRFAYKDAPMGIAGVDRGWEFYKINDISVSTMESPWEAFDTDSEMKFTFITTANDTVDRSMTRTDYEINTVLHKSVLDVSDRKVGYLVYESFLGEKSIAELDEAFSFFTSEGIEDIIVDLRYNGGGSLWSAYHLSAQLGGNEIENKHFISFLYNENREDEGGNYSIPTAEYEVNLPRVYFITTEGSASASEMVINCLFPYKEVILIGEKTHGKPVGMEVENSEDYNIALAAVTFQLLNAHGNGHYFNGIPVDYEVDDDIFHAWGDPEEDCLKKALQLISGEGDEVAIKSARLRSVPVPLKRGLQEITGAY